MAPKFLTAVEDDSNRGRLAVGVVDLMVGYIEFGPVIGFKFLFMEFSSSVSFFHVFHLLPVNLSYLLTFC